MSKSRTFAGNIRSEDAPASPPLPAVESLTREESLKRLRLYSRPRHTKILEPGEIEALIDLLRKSGLKPTVIRMQYGIHVKCQQFEVTGQA